MSSLFRKNSYKFLRAQIVAGKLTPGMRLMDNELARQMGVSRTPVREAISQLEHEGLAERPQGSGTFVKLLSGRELREMMQLRVVLESYAVQAATPGLSPADIKLLQATCDRLHEYADEASRSSHDGKGMIFGSRPEEANETFHLVFVRALGNQRVSRLLSDVWLMTQTARDFYLAQSGRSQMFSLAAQLSWTWYDHTRILRAIQDRDGAKAATLMGTHIMRFATRLHAGYDEWAEKFRSGGDVVSEGSPAKRWLLSGELDGQDDREPGRSIRRARRSRRDAPAT